VDVRSAPAAGVAHPRASHLGKRSLWRELLVLFKVREVLLLLFAAVGGAFLAARGWPGAGRLAVLLVSGGLAAAGASAVNQFLEREPDARMERTRRRPLVTGAIARPGWVPWLGALLILLPAAAVLRFNSALSLFLLLGAAVYIGVYTLWLKPRTLLNVVIGGLAGSAAVLSGSAAAGHWNDPAALLLALLVFVWTPAHFWSLALAHREDYARGGFPMLPVPATPRASAWWVLLHSAGTVLAALALVPLVDSGTLYGVPIAVAGLCLLLQNARLIANPSRNRALSLFTATNLYLALVVWMVCVSSLIR
jgi:protoheme IX farnesyltransferase